MLEPGRCYLAPGGYHLTVDRTATGTIVSQLDDGPRIKNCRPSVERLFASAGETFGGALLAVVLTGMGNDGVDACHGLADAGVEIIVQDEATSVVWGMAGAVAQAGLAHRCLPVGQIARAIRVAVEQSLGQKDAVSR